MSHVRPFKRPPVPKQISCLACGDVRVVFGLSSQETGECQRCRYVGWQHSDELDGTTQRAILSAHSAAAALRRDVG